MGRSPLRSKRKGYEAERRLVKLLSRKPGNYVFRVPVSGGRSSPDSAIAFPDVFLVNNVEDRIVAFEVKSTSHNSVKVRRSQVLKLLKFLAPFKKYSRREAVIAVWFSRDGKWVFRAVRDPLCQEDVVIRHDDESDWMP